MNTPQTHTHPTGDEMEAAEQLRDTIAEKYGRLAQNVLDGDQSGSCCGPATETDSCCGPATAAPEGNPITSDLYSAQEAGAIPDAAIAASLGCGNPTALADLEEGQVVLDLGSGGGIDVLLSARRVGPTGYAYGLDMTDEMLDLARRNQAEAGVENVEFLKGAIEDVPLPDDSVDVIISNCVVNLSTDKARVLREANRVLKPGGLFAISDIVIRGDIDPQIRKSVEAWIGCVAGALEEDEYHSLLEAAGFSDIEIVPTREYTYEDGADFLDGADIDEDIVRRSEGKVVSAFVRARSG